MGSLLTCSSERLNKKRLQDISDGDKEFEKELVKHAGELDNTLEAVSTGKDVVYWRVLKGHTLDSTFGKYMNKAANTPKAISNVFVGKRSDTTNKAAMATPIMR